MAIESTKNNMDSQERISTLRRENQKLREIAQKFRILFEYSADAIMTLDPEKGFLSGNPATVRLFGCRDESDFVSRSPAELSPQYQPDGESSSQKAQRMMEIAFREGSNFFEWMHKRVDGRNFFTTVLLTRINIGGQDLLQATVRDITAQKLAELKLAQQNRFLKTVIDSLAYPFYVINTKDYSIQIANSAASAGKDLAGKLCYQSIRNGTEPCAGDNPCPWAEIKQTRKAATAEHTTYDQDGNLKVEKIYSYPIFDDKGEIVQIIEYLIDITERKQIEYQLKQEHANYKRLVNAVPVGMFIINDKFDITYGNELLAEMVGRTAAELHDIKMGEWLGCLHVHDATGGCGSGSSCNVCELRRIISETFCTGTAARDLEFQYRFLINGVIVKRWLKICTERVQISGRYYVVVALRDITRQKTADIQSRQAEKLQSIGQLASGIAHEINTPIQYIGDNIKFLQESFQDILKLMSEYEQICRQVLGSNLDPELPARMQKTLEEIDIDYLTEEIPTAIHESLEGVEIVSRIVRAMKEFAHPGGQEMAMANINNAMENTVTVARNRWKYIATLQLDLDPDLPPVYCQIDQLNQVFLNLIVNAADAIAEKNGDGCGEKGEINISTRRLGDWVEIRVADTGKGIPQEIHDQIMNPFFTTKEVGKGSGQGLAIAHSVIVDKHSGRLTFETEEGKGTTFIIRLPIIKDEPSGDKDNEEAHFIC